MKKKITAMLLAICCISSTWTVYADDFSSGSSEVEIEITEMCIRDRKKGTQKHPVEEAEFVEDWGIKNDAHAGKWHRQVSLLSYDKIEAFRARGAEVEDGAFGENLVEMCIRDRDWTVSYWQSMLENTGLAGENYLYFVSVDKDFPVLDLSLIHI